MDWVHCNLCFHQPGDGTQYFLTNCGHIYCTNCIKQGTENKCKMCGQSCTKITLSSKMKPEVQLFFSDHVDLIRKQQKQLQQAMQVMEFQQCHRQRLMAHNREKSAKQASLIGQAQKAIDRCHTLERELMVKNEEISYLKKVINSSTSPCGKRVHRQASPSQSMMHHSGHDFIGVSRLSVRTPPSGGKMGSIPGNVSHSHLSSSQPVGHSYSGVNAGSPMTNLSDLMARRKRNPTPMIGTPTSFAKDNQPSPCQTPSPKMMCDDIVSSSQKVTSSQQPRQKIQLSYSAVAQRRPLRSSPCGEND